MARSKKLDYSQAIQNLRLSRLLEVPKKEERPLAREEEELSKVSLSVVGSDRAEILCHRSRRRSSALMLVFEPPHIGIFA